MAWSYFCEDEKLTITADTKEELARKVMEHVNEAHNGEMNYMQAMEQVNQNAKQSAA